MSRKQSKRARFAASMKRSRQIGAEVRESYRAWLDRIAANRIAFMSRDEARAAASSRLAQDIDRMVYERALGKQDSVLDRNFEAIFKDMAKNASEAG